MRGALIEGWEWAMVNGDSTPLEETLEVFAFELVTLPD